MLFNIALVLQALINEHQGSRAGARRQVPLSPRSDGQLLLAQVLANLAARVVSPPELSGLAAAAARRVLARYDAPEH